jgi:hypothetical protein
LRSAIRAALFLALFGAPGCSCSRLHGEVDDLEFTRCAQIEAPAEGSYTLDKDLKVEVRDRVARVSSDHELKIAAFTGPVEGPLSRADVAALAAAQASVILYLGGLGDSVEAATASLQALAPLSRPVLFIAGGADRLPVVEAAFDELGDVPKSHLLNASGLRLLEIGAERFAIVAGAPLGRYALDEDACGFTQEDLDDVRDAVPDRKGRTWLLSWAAPAGFGVTRGHGGREAGSPELAALAKAIGARGGLFAYPEVQAGTPARAGGDGFALVVPRLGRTGSLREGRGFVARGLSLVSVSSSGIALLARP